MKMNRLIVAALPLLLAAAGAFAQSPESSIRESTDPARVAEVERRAQELRSAQSTTGSSGQSQMQRSASGDHARMHGDRMHRDRTHRHGPPHGQHGHHGMRGDHPRAAPGPAR